MSKDERIKQLEDEVSRLKDELEKLRHRFIQVAKVAIAKPSPWEVYGTR